MSLLSPVGLKAAVATDLSTVLAALSGSFRMRNMPIKDCRSVPAGMHGSRSMLIQLAISPMDSLIGCKSSEIVQP